MFLKAYILTAMYGTPWTWSLAPWSSSGVNSFSAACAAVDMYPDLSSIDAYDQYCIVVTCRSEVPSDVMS